MIKLLDCEGLSCPDPLNTLRHEVNKSKSGDIIEIYSDDPTSSDEFANYCRFMKHELVSKKRKGLGYIYTIKV